MIRPAGYCTRMNEDTLIQHENAFYHAVKDGPATKAQIAKKTKLSDEEVDDLVQYFQNRLWVETDDTGKDTTFTLTQQGRNDMSARYT